MGDAIPLVAQIIGLVDAFDAITTQRAYQPAHPTEHAVDTLRDQVRRGWRRADITESFVKLVEAGMLGNITGNQTVSWDLPTS
jgi:response regulator RpfG family c-di-GMP phosphodiesterase